MRRRRPCWGRRILWSLWSLARLPSLARGLFQNPPIPPPPIQKALTLRALRYTEHSAGAVAFVALCVEWTVLSVMCVGLLTAAAFLEDRLRAAKANPRALG